MTVHSNIPWEKINEFLIEIENIRDPRTFYEILLNNLHQFISYDQARIYESDLNGKIIGSVIIKVDQWWSNAYIDYYSKISNNINRREEGNTKDNSHYQKHRVLCWKDYESDEFIVDYIEPQGIKYTLGFDLKNSVSIAECGLDRITGTNFTKQETEILDILQPHLQNFYLNLPYYQCDQPMITPALDEILTEREKEIADLLVKGVKPSRIGQHLYISQGTVYRHIANIHSKLNVSNRQELLLKLMKF